MRVSLALLFSLMDSTVLAAIIPTNLVDDVYLVRRDQNGHEVRELLNFTSMASDDDKSLPKSINTRYLSPDGQSAIRCGCDFPLDPDSTDAAVQLVKGAIYVDPRDSPPEYEFPVTWVTIPPGGRVQRPRYGVMAFICNLSDHDIEVSQSMFTRHLERITEACG